MRIFVPRSQKKKTKRSKYSSSYIKKFSKNMRRNPTAAERQFEDILLILNGGVLRGRFKSQYAFSGDWILDFFFPENRLGIEIDGGVHDNPLQIEKDKKKQKDCHRFDITLIRFKNAEVFGDREQLIRKLRSGWKAALHRENKIIGTKVPFSRSTLASQKGSEG